MTTYRIATVNKTGKRYIVQQISFGKVAKVHCWGECISHKGLKSKHEESITLLLSDVTVSEVEVTAQLLAGLFDQAVAGRRALGHDLRTTRSGNVVDEGTAEQRAALQAERDGIANSLASSLTSMLRSTRVGG